MLALAHPLSGASVDVVRQITPAFSAAFERLRGGHGLTSVTAYLADTAAPMLRGHFPTEALRGAAFGGAAAELVYLAGWKHHDLGREGAAQRYHQVGNQLAWGRALDHDGDPRAPKPTHTATPPG